MKFSNIIQCPQCGTYRLANQQCRRCNVAPEQEQEPEPPEPKPRRQRGPNKTEAEYKRLFLDTRDDLVSVHYEGITLLLGERCRYTPDWACFRSDSTIELHEVKGAHVWDDARVKFKTAKTIYPRIKFVWAQKTRKGWKREA